MAGTQLPAASSVGGGRMTTLALVIVVDVFTAAFVLGLAFCKDVPVYQLPRRTPGAALVLDVPAVDMTVQLPLSLSPDAVQQTLDGLRSLPYVALSQTIGDRARARGAAATQEFYRQRHTDDTPTQRLTAVTL
jgi:hypothetical protein